MGTADPRHIHLEYRQSQLLEEAARRRLAAGRDEEPAEAFFDRRTPFRAAHRHRPARVAAIGDPTP
jgi:hypothetical protein